jgi:hypothetical protein
MSTPPGDTGRFGGNSNPQRPATQAPSGGNVFTRKMGPLPLWAWMGIALALALVFSIWKKNKAASSSSTSGSLSITPPGSSADATTAASQIPQFVNLTNVSNSQAQNQTQSQNNTTNNTTPPTTPTPPPPTTTPTPPTNTSKYVTVTVGQWPTGGGGNPSASENSFGAGTAAWNSTLWGIATHYNVPGGYQALATLNGISNPNLIFPGQQIKVPVTS